MRNVIKRAVLLSKSSIIDVSVLPDEMFKDNVLKNTEPNNLYGNQVSNGSLNDQEDLKLFSSKNEEQLIRTALEKAKYNKTKAAQILGIGRGCLTTQKNKKSILKSQLKINKSEYYILKSVYIDYFMLTKT